MYLEKLEIHGFKSFAQKTILEFPDKIKGVHSITGIVGPNGSGKSNVADAIRWVLGETSIKTLRGKKGQDVIFSGSDKKARLGFAEASLYLNNEDKQADLDYSEIIITRRVYQSGESEYFINKSKARLGDIHMLLAKANFGQRTYSIIGQGMADSVLSASLQERKDLFDEAVGVKQFQIKRDQTLNKFKSTRENLAQTELTLQEIEPRLKSLTRQVKKLEKREEIEKELKKLQLNYYSHIWQNLENKIKKVRQNKKGSDKNGSGLKDEIDDIKKEIEIFSNENSRQSEFDKIQDQYNELISQKNLLLHDQTILKAKINLDLEKQGQGNIVWLNKRKDELGSQIKNNKHKVNEIENLIIQEENNLKNKTNQLDSINGRLETVKTELSQIQNTTQIPFEQDKEIEDIFNQQQNLVEQLINVKKIEELEEIKSQARKISQKLSLYLEKLKNFKSQETEDIINLQKQLEKLSGEKNDLTNETNQVTLNLNIKKEKIEALNNEIENYNFEIAKIDKEIDLSQTKGKKTINTKIIAEIKEIEEKIEQLEKKINEQEMKIKKFNHEEQNKKEKLINLQQDFQEKQLKLNLFSQEINQFEIELAKHTTKQEDIETDIRYNRLELEKIRNHQSQCEINQDATYEKIEQSKRQLEIIGGIDDETQSEYKEIKERYDFLSSQSQDLEEAIKKLEEVIEELDKNIREQFDKAFKEINKEFQKYFKMLFNGGSAELIKINAAEVKKEEKEETEDEDDEEDEGVLAKADKFAKRIKEKEKEAYAGIEIKANPPGKKIKSISMLSGGERALTSIALICAIISNNPSPFIVLDEIDAPLDEANAERFNLILQELSKKTQFIVVTHNRVTMHYANVLYGITMSDDGISKLLSIKLADAEEMVGQT